MSLSASILLVDDDHHLADSMAGWLREMSHEVETALRERGIIASARGPAIRLAPHFYSTLEDVDRALDALAGVLKPLNPRMMRRLRFHPHWGL